MDVLILTHLGLFVLLDLAILILFVAMDYEFLGFSSIKGLKNQALFFIISGCS